MTLQDAMLLATSEILRASHLSSRRFETPRQINDGDCFNWASKVFNLVPGTAIGGHRIDGEGHSFIIYKGMCYDSEMLDGTLNWWNLPKFQRIICGVFKGFDRCGILCLEDFE